MDEDQIVESVKVAMFAADRGGASEEDVARAAIEAHTAALADAGFVIVPRKPTQEMLDAVCSDDPNAFIRAHDGPVRETYREMIAAAPDQR